MNLLHRPRETYKRVLMKDRRYGNTINYNFCGRVKWYPAGWGVNKQTIGNMHSKLHYLACHAPLPIQKKWRKVYEVFQKKHFGDSKRGSMRFLNNHSCHSWL